jgi:hypothetical protein
MMFPWIVGSSAATNQHQHKTIGTTIIARPVFPEVIKSLASIKSDKFGNYYIMISEDHSIVVYDNQLKYVRRIGQVGKGPGEFYYPRDFALGQQSEIYVADHGNDRIQVLDPNGGYLRHFRFPSPVSVAVLSSGEILVIGVYDDELIRVYSPEGKFLRTIGTPVDVGVEDPKLNAYLNRGRVTVDQSNHIYYLFRTLLDPTVRKYNLAGKLLMEIHPRGDRIFDIISRARVRLQQSIEKGELHASATLNAIQTDPATGHIWIAPAGPILYVYTAEGRKLVEYRLQDTSGRMHGAINFALVGKKGCFSNPAGCFIFDLPEMR